MAVLEIILTIILALLGIAVIVIVAMQEPKQQGLGAIDGSSQTFLKRQGGRTKEEQLNRYTIIGGIAIVVLSILMVILQKIG